ncbi:MAG: type IV pilin protein [Candidatus Sumerlaeaceae bacterium]
MSTGPFRGRKPHRSAFTLIELLIVVAIIAILASIAVVNFLEAQTRSKVSRVKSDMRTIATAIESYRVDENKYPFYLNSHDKGFPSYPRTSPGSLNERCYNFCVPTRITSPVAYLTSIPDDQFPNKRPAEPYEGQPHPFHYGNDEDFSANPNAPQPSADRYPVRFLYTLVHKGLQLKFSASPPRHVFLEIGDYMNDAVVWSLISHAPDTDYDNFDDLQINQTVSYEGDPRPYDPTNGTLSGGDIYWWGPGIGLK